MFDEAYWALHTHKVLRNNVCKIPGDVGSKVKYSIKKSPGCIMERFVLLIYSKEQKRLARY